ncbi:MAG: methionine--tRNA ligase [candidate division Zixibacteria bacterium]|nr:methionine--tRNA ligase [candidate division Zixibacteria bacterium]
MQKFYITTPIYYVNDKPHIGHAYTTILADVLAGYHRLLGYPTYFLTGTDEHGQKVQDSALAKNITPQKHCDLYAKRFKDTWKELNIKNDDFIRTTQKRHKKIVVSILEKVYQSKTDDGKPLIYEDNYEGWYCKHEERYWTEKDLIDGNCPDCGRPVQKLSEKNYFFRMSYYQQWLIDYINANPEFIQPDFRRNEVLGFLKQPLGDLCVSRPKSRLSWGIELPFDKDYVCYVWFDALINYISAIGYDPKTDKFEKEWWPAVNLIGKDILTTHAVYWPCMLKAIGVELPKTIFAHGFWIQAGAKMSKSLGNVINPLDLKEKYGVDPFRFYLVREMTIGHDSNYSEESFVQRYNSDLANDLGNLLSRTLKMIASYCDSKIPNPPYDINGEIKDVPFNWLNIHKEIPQDLRDFKLNKIVENIMQFIRSVNKYIEQNKPWELVKNNQNEKLDEVLYNSAEALLNAAAYLSPIIPNKAAEIVKQLGHSSGNKLFSGELKVWGNLQPGTSIQKGDSLFPRLKKSKPEKDAPSAKKEEFITFDDFKKLKLRVAEVISAEKVKGTDKLLKLQIKIGQEQRQIVAGIAKTYKPEEMIGKKIVVVINLEPAQIRGVKSNGMLLAASKKDKMVLLTIDSDMDSGAKIG